MLMHTQLGLVSEEEAVHKFCCVIDVYGCAVGIDCGFGRRRRRILRQQDPT